MDQRKGPGWQSDWDACFAKRAEASALSDVKAAYTNLMAYLAEAMGVTKVDEHMLGASQLPSNHGIGPVQAVSKIPADQEVAGQLDYA
jgi:hypothetical protein